MSQELNQRWQQFTDKGFVMSSLSNEEIDFFIRAYSSDGINAVLPKDRAKVFISEKNGRNADKVARTGLMLACVAVGVGVVQVILAIIPFIPFK